MRKDFRDLFSKVYLDLELGDYRNDSLTFGCDKVLFTQLYEREYAKRSLFEAELKRVIEYFNGFIETGTNQEKTKESRNIVWFEMLLVFMSVARGGGSIGIKNLKVPFQNHRDFLKNYVEKYVAKMNVLFRNTFHMGKVISLMELYLEIVPNDFAAIVIETIENKDVEGNKHIEYRFEVKPQSKDAVKRVELYKRILNSEHPFHYKLKESSFPRYVYPDKSDLKGKMTYVDGYFKMDNQFQRNRKKTHHLQTPLKGEYDREIDFPFTQLLDIRAVEKSKRSIIGIKIDLYQVAKLLDEESNSIRFVRALEEELGIYSVDMESQSLKELTTYTVGNKQHITGMVGAGKTTIALLIIKGLVLQGFKITLSVGDISETLDWIRKLKKIGIKAAGMKGRSKKDDQFCKHIVNIQKNYNDIGSMLEAEEDALRFLDDASLADLHFDYHTEDFSYQENMRIDKKSIKWKRSANKSDYVEGEIPDFIQSPLYDRYYDMLEADVWVMNYHVMVKSYLPKGLDVYSREWGTIIEHWSDLIVFDEVDDAQKKHDGIFEGDIDITQDKPPKNLSANEGYLDYLIRRDSSFRKSDRKSEFTRTFHKKLVTSLRYANEMYYLLGENNIKKFIQLGKPFSVIGLLRELFKNTYEFDKSKTGPSDEDKDYFIRKGVDCFIYEKDIFSNLGDTLSGAWKRYKAVEENFFSSKEVGITLDNMIAAAIPVIEHIPDILNHKANTSMVRIRKKPTKKNLHFGKTRIIDRAACLFIYIRCFNELNENLGYVYENAEHYLLEMEREAKGNPEIIPYEIRRESRLKPFLPSPLLTNQVPYKIMFDKTESGKPGTLKRFVYESVGREVLDYWGNLLSGLEDGAGCSSLILSATSYMRESTMYHTRIEPTHIIENKRQQGLNVDIKFFPIVKDGQILYVSGQDEENREKALKQIIKELYKNNVFHDELNRMEEDKKRNRDKRRRIIAIPVPSYEACKWVEEALSDVGCKLKVRTHVRNKEGIEGEEDLFTKNEIEQMHEYDVDIVIMVFGVTARAYNILQGQGAQNSLIGSMFFPIRPYPVPDDFSQLIQRLHGEYQKECKSLDEQKLSLGEEYELLNQVIGKMYSLYSKLSTNTMGWKGLYEDERIIIAANYLVEFIQMSGRGMRGGTNLRIHFCCGSFAGEKTIKATEEKIFGDAIGEYIPMDDTFDSYLSIWEYLLHDKSDFLKDLLYKPFKEGMRGLTTKEELIWAEK